MKEVVVVSSDRGHRKKYADKVLITFHQGADVQIDGKHVSLHVRKSTI